ncbi:DUF805 domain-containing protein [Rhizobium sp. AQ_MP]|uniref:DUF805 domain-containing protein n=1 Tax=Rhizobium sp. AQ_MP TaxID=2761536 RepID=UPI00163B53D3|nr:DUF805 domain-containing protein [Rhizobium sp. AQ_MP]MBC2771528.1 DUF805 domain-containing protein [Rhizobium sp. AQ_MP]
MALPGREISVGWALFLWDGRIGRRVFILGTLFWMMANAAVVAFVTGSDEISPGSFSLFLTTASLSLLSLLMLGTKRLHDIGMSGIAAAFLVIPAFSLIAFFLLCVWPSTDSANRYGTASNRRAG